MSCLCQIGIKMNWRNVWLPCMTALPRLRHGKSARTEFASLPRHCDHFLFTTAFDGVTATVIGVLDSRQNPARTLGVGQDTISRIEKRSDMLLSRLRRYVEAMGGRLELVGQFPDRPPMVIDHLTSATSLSIRTPAGQLGANKPHF